MRILVATHYWRPHRGGIEQVAFEQARRLVKRGHEVAAITSRGGADPAVQDDEGIRVERIFAFNPLEKRGVPYPLFSPALAVQALRLAREADVVMAHSHAFLSSLAAIAAARMNRTPSLVLQHNTFIDYPQPLLVLEHLADASIGAITLRTATKRLAVSDRTQQYVQKISGRECGVLHNGVDAARFHPPGTGERAGLRRSFGLPEDARLALSVRRLSFKNGIDTLLEAARLCRGREDLHFVVAGSGPDRARLDRFLTDERLRNVTPLGFVPDERLSDLYRACDLFVLPSRSGEGMPLVVLEAFASGLPCIVTRSGGQEEFVTEGETGWLVTPADARALADAVQAATSERLAAMARAARQVAEGLDWELQVTLLEKHLAGLG